MNKDQIKRELAELLPEDISSDVITRLAIYVVKKLDNNSPRKIMNLKEHLGLRTLKGKTDRLPEFWARHNTLVLIKNDGRSAMGSNVGVKTELLDNYKEDEGDALLFVWNGQWSNDVFLIDNEDLVRLNQRVD